VFTPSLIMPQPQNKHTHTHTHAHTRTHTTRKDFDGFFVEDDEEDEDEDEERGYYAGIDPIDAARRKRAEEIRQQQLKERKRALKLRAQDGGHARDEGEAGPAVVDASRKRPRDQHASVNTARGGQERVSSEVPSVARTQDRGGHGQQLPEPQHRGSQKQQQHQQHQPPSALQQVGKQNGIGGRGAPSAPKVNI
jgi:hypothetical protein